jgi:hypothetical protein
MVLMEIMEEHRGGGISAIVGPANRPRRIRSRALWQFFIEGSPNGTVPVMATMLTRKFYGSPIRAVPARPGGRVKNWRILLPIPCYVQMGMGEL